MRRRFNLSVRKFVCIWLFSAFALSWAVFGLAVWMNNLTQLDLGLGDYPICLACTFVPAVVFPLLVKYKTASEE